MALQFHVTREEFADLQRAAFEDEDGRGLLACVRTRFPGEAERMLIAHRSGLTIDVVVTDSVARSSRRLRAFEESVWTGKEHAAWP